MESDKNKKNNRMYLHVLNRFRQQQCEGTLKQGVMDKIKKKLRIKFLKDGEKVVRLRPSF